MKLSTLKASSFVGYFSHLPPDEALQRCLNLSAAVEDICGDVENWKAYVAKRYGLKFSLQRPDLLTTEEWIQQARILERLKPTNFTRVIDDDEDFHNYVAATGVDGNSWLFPANTDHPTRFNFKFKLQVLVVGLPIVISDETRGLKYHVSKFEITKKLVVNYLGGVGLMGEKLPDLDEKHPTVVSSFFESSEYSTFWSLEMLIPYYSFYLRQGYRFNRVRLFDASGVQGLGQTIQNFQRVLEVLRGLFQEERAFELYLMLNRHDADGVRIPTDEIRINLQYIPSKLA